ncbi:MAG: GNAT family N-acetyltransferase [Ruminococcus sp.]|nr:GNAT family N-acetyltransferase [Ruminococcus sp.]
MIEIQQVSEQKKQYLPLLLLGDEQESMIDRYLEQGTLYVMQKAGNPIAVCVILRVSETEWEVKNLAVAVSEQGKGYGRKFLQFLEQQLAGTAEWLILGTGDSPKTIPFYQKCGFVPYRRIPHFFAEHYDHPIIEDGVLLDDMVYLRKSLSRSTSEF